MGFIKVGDSAKITGILENNGEELICEECNEPIVTVAILENNGLKSICKCENYDVEQLNA